MHCVAGVSRSVALVIAYLIKHYRISLHEALTLVKSRRSIVTIIICTDKSQLWVHEAAHPLPPDSLRPSVLEMPFIISKQKDVLVEIDRTTALPQEESVSVEE